MNSQEKSLSSRRIIAVDFDGTIVEDNWPDFGEIKQEVVEKMKKEKYMNDAYIIIWTCRSGSDLSNMQNFLIANEIPYDRINANAPWILDEWKRDNRKIFAHEYWDDKAINVKDIEEVQMDKIEGMGNNVPVKENEEGGKQSDIPYRFDLIDAPALFNMAGVYREGAEKYEPDNWRKISVEEHLNHALAHIFAYLAGDYQEDHLGHAQCRMNMAKAVQIEKDN